MTSPPATRPTSHRAATPVSVITRKLLPPLAAVTAVVLVILLLVVLNSRPTPPGPAPGAVAQSSETDGTGPDSPSPTPSASVTATSAASVPPPPVSPPPATQSPAQAAMVPVTVLNNSRRHGLAAHVAAELHAKGWPIRRTGNFTGRIRETTAYYAPGQRAVALRLAHEFGQITRVLPRFRGLPGTGLTLVVTRDWTG